MDFKNVSNFNSQEQAEESCFPKLSWNERLIGFAICCVLGTPPIMQVMSYKFCLSGPS